MNSNEWVGVCNITKDQLPCGPASSVRCGVPVARRLYTVLMCRLSHRLSSHPVLLGVVNSDQDMAVDKFHESPTMYVLFISVSVKEVVPVSVSDSTS